MGVLERGGGLWLAVVGVGWLVKVQETLGGASLSDGPGYLCENTGYF